VSECVPPIKMSPATK